MIFEKLAAIYFWVEEKYYDFTGFLQEKIHVPIYDFFINPLENRGIKSLPISLLVLTALIFSISTLVQNRETIDFSITAFAGSVNFKGKIALHCGTIVEEKNVDNGVANFKLERGLKCNATFSNNGKVAASREVIVGEKQQYTFDVKGPNFKTNFIVKLENQNGSPIGSTSVKLVLANGSINAREIVVETDSNGTFKLNEIEVGEKITIIINGIEETVSVENPDEQFQTNATIELNVEKKKTKFFVKAEGTGVAGARIKIEHGPKAEEVETSLQGLVEIETFEAELKISVSKQGFKTIVKNVDAGKEYIIELEAEAVDEFKTLCDCKGTEVIVGLNRTNLRLIPSCLNVLLVSTNSTPNAEASIKTNDELSKVCGTLIFKLEGQTNGIDGCASINGNKLEYRPVPLCISNSKPNTGSLKLKVGCTNLLGSNAEINVVIGNVERQASEELC